MSDAQPLPPIEELLPHRHPMLLLDRLLSGDDSGVTARASVSPAAWYAAAEGAMPAWIAIELMAQALAAHVGLRARAEGRPPRPGVLLGCRAYRSVVARIAAGTALRIEARVSFADEGGFAAYDCSVAGPDGEIASATLKVFEPPDFAAFLASVGNA